MTWQKMLKQAKKVATRSVGGSASLPTGYDCIYEQTEDGFAIYSPNTQKAYSHQELEAVGVTYKPYGKIPWNLPPAPIEYDSELELWNEIKQCIYEHLDHPNEATYDVLTAWIMATWRLEEWKSVPFIFSYGALETGKTRMLEILAALSFRGWMSLYVTAPNLYRILEEWHCCLCLDETESYLDSRDIIALLNGSYRRGQLIPRQIETKEGYETKFFNAFGFKALAGTRKLVKTLSSRCIVFKMSRATRKINLFIDEEQTRKLRGKLLLYRFRKLTEETEDNEGVPERGIEPFAEEVGGGRIAEMFWPLYQVAPTDELKSLITKHAIKIGQSRMEELAMSDEVTTLSAIMYCYNEGSIKHGLILLQDITIVINRDLSTKEEWTNRRVGALCGRLGFVKVRASSGLTAIRYDSKLIERLRKDKRYESCFTPLSGNASLSSESSKNWLEKTFKRSNE